MTPDGGGPRSDHSVSRKDSSGRRSVWGDRSAPELRLVRVLTACALLQSLCKARAIPLSEASHAPPFSGWGRPGSSSGGLHGGRSFHTTGLIYLQVVLLVEPATLASSAPSPDSWTGRGRGLRGPEQGAARAGAGSCSAIPVQRLSSNCNVTSSFTQSCSYTATEIRTLVGWQDVNQQT